MMSDVQVLSVVENIQLQTTHAPQLPASSYVAPPEKGYICNHCLGIFVCIKTARKHHATCKVVCNNRPALPCQVLKGAACDACFAGARYCNCARCTAVQPYCATRRPRPFDETAAAAAAETFRAAEETLRNVSSRAQ